MPELFIELFSEEIPARMQARAADDLCRLLGEALAPLSPAEMRGLHGPRRIAACATVEAEVLESRLVERGPRRTAPEQALAGFLRKHGADRADLREEGDFWVLDRVVPGLAANRLVADVLPGLLRRFPWPKSMRWGGTSGFTWVRPLRRIVCLLDGAVVPFDLREGADDGHGLMAGRLSEGHRFHAPGAFEVTSCAQWAAELRTRRVVVNAAERRAMIAEGLRDLAATRGLAVMEDAGLLDEVAGLVEWPVPLIGAIDAAHMDLPPEVMQVSMRVNQRYFALRDALGRPAPFFAFVANIEAPDGGRTIVAGNERVLRARFSDARHFWDLDRKAKLESRVAALDGITFHAKLGTQGDRVRRLVKLAGIIAPLAGADAGLAERAALLAKADLTTGMVGEFPELQGVMGGYYAAHDGEAAAVAAAVRDHYLPKGPGDVVPESPVGVAVALADKLDQLVAFFAVGEKPSGSGDPFALRRAALGIIRILRERKIRLSLLPVLECAAESANDDSYSAWLSSASGSRSGGFEHFDHEDLSQEVLDFIYDRLKVQMKLDGTSRGVLAAVRETGGDDDDIQRLLVRTQAVADFVCTEAGSNLLAAYRRATNLLRIEEKKGGEKFDGAIDSALLEEFEEGELALAIGRTGPEVADAIADERFTDAMASLAQLRGPVDAFFDAILVNAERPELRQNRLQLLFHLRAAMNMAADFSRIEG